MSRRRIPLAVTAGQDWSLIDRNGGRFVVHVGRIEGDMAHCVRVATGAPHTIRIATLASGLRGAMPVGVDTSLPKSPPRPPRKPASERHPNSRILVITDQMRKAWRLFHVDKLSCVVIGARFGVSRSAVSNWIRAVDDEAQRGAA